MCQPPTVQPLSFTELPGRFGRYELITEPPLRNRFRDQFRTVELQMLCLLRVVESVQRVVNLFSDSRRTVMMPFVISGRVDDGRSQTIRGFGVVFVGLQDLVEYPVLLR